MLTTCNFIEDGESDSLEVQLSLILDKIFSPSSAASLWMALESLYLQVLKWQAVTAKASDSCLNHVHEILGVIVTDWDPLFAPSLGTLLDLHLCGCPQTPVVTVCHPAWLSALDSESFPPGCPFTP